MVHYGDTLKTCFCMLVLVILALLNYTLYYQLKQGTVVVQLDYYRPILTNNDKMVPVNNNRTHRHPLEYGFVTETVSEDSISSQYNEQEGSWYSKNISLSQHSDTVANTIDAPTVATTDFNKPRSPAQIIQMAREKEPSSPAQIIQMAREKEPSSPAQIIQMAREKEPSSPAQIIQIEKGDLTALTHMDPERATESSSPNTSQSLSLAKATALTAQSGYILAMKIYEQQTMASGNLLQLQCLATLLNLLVVKPFMADSYLKIPLDETKQATMMRFEDTFDMEEWNKHVEQEGYSPLVEWRQFIRQAPRKVVYVQLKYPLLSAVKTMKSNGHPFPHPLQGSMYQTGCKFRSLNTKALTSRGFEVVRRVCINFLYGDEFTVQEFQKYILGSYQSSEVTIIMNEWRGVGESQRVLIRERICKEDNPFREEVKPSPRLIHDALRYTEEFLGGREYLAIISRFEMTALTRKVSDNDDPHAIIPYCLKLTLQHWQRLKKDAGLDTTFLSIDIGRYGSISFQQKKYYGHLREMMHFVTEVHGGRTTVQEWEKTFETVAQTTDAGYIAMLQQVIVTRAKCILFVGGGSFQRHALHLYKQLHPNPSDQCVRVVERCTSAYRPIE